MKKVSVGKRQLARGIEESAKKGKSTRNGEKFIKTVNKEVGGTYYGSSVRIRHVNDLIVMFVYRQTKNDLSEDFK